MTQTGKIGLRLAVAALVVLVAGPSLARDQIRIVGSSTVFPFSTSVAERFGRATGFKVPVVESTGSGGGLKLFCAGVGVGYPDITNSSRQIKPRELQNCLDNGVTEIVEAKIGSDGIAVANARSAEEYSLTREILYLALAREIPSGGQVVPNPHRRWSDVDPSLPETRIEVLGPPPTSGTRDAFEELALQVGCQEAGAGEAGIDCKAVEIRADGVWTDASENDNLIVSKLTANRNALGVFGYSFLEQNAGTIQGARIGGVEPDLEDISSGRYPLSRSLYFYVKKAHIGVVPGLEGYLQAFVSPEAVGEDGYLLDKGLVPLSKAECAAVLEHVTALIPVTRDELH